MKVEKHMTVMGDGKLINVYLDRYRGNGFLGSKLIHTLTIEEADKLVRELSAEVHRDPRGDLLINRFGGTS